jgi:hypothetical protein
MRSDDKTKGVWGLGFYRYQINEPMSTFEMDCKVGERRLKYVYFTPEEEVFERGAFSMLILVGVSILEGAS